MPISTASTRHGHKQGGFTLIEVIVTLVVLALVGTIGALALSDTKAKLFTATTAVSDLNDVHDCLETMIAEFDALRSTNEDENGGATAAFFAKYSDITQMCSSGVQVSKTEKDPHSFNGALHKGTLYLLTVQKNTARLDYVLGD